MVNLPRRMVPSLKEIKEICRTEKEPAVLWERLKAVILKAVPGDLGAFAIMDPVSSLIVDGYGYGDPEITRKYISDYYLKRELYSYFDQRADGAVMSHVSQYTRGEIEKDPLYRDWLRYEGYKHGARVSFVARSHYWGGLCCIRGADTPDFNQEELTFLRLLVEPVGTALQTSAAWKQAHSPLPSDTPLPDAAALFLDKNHRVLFRTEGAQAIIDDIIGSDSTSTKERLNKIGVALPAPVLAASASLSAALDNGEDMAGSSITLKGLSQWWTVTATVPEHDMSKVVATVLILARAHPRDTAAVLLATYNLSSREKEIVYLIRQGLSTVAIAKSLFISRYTVQDHLKNIFSKVGVRTRGELMAVIFREESPLGRTIAQNESNRTFGVRDQTRKTRKAKALEK